MAIEYLPDEKKGIIGAFASFEGGKRLQCQCNTSEKVSVYSGAKQHQLLGNALQKAPVSDLAS